MKKDTTLNANFIEVKYLTELVNCNSFDTTNNNDIVNYLVKAFNNFSKEIKLLKNNDNPNLNNVIVGVNTELKNVNNAILLSAHIDTVMPSNNNKRAYVKNGKLFGLGSCDMKAFIANILTLKSYLITYERPLILCFTADEETKLKGVNEVISFLKENNINADFVLIGEPTNYKFAVGNKGCFEYQINVQGVSCHSSNPKLGKNAIYIAMKLVNYIKKLNNKNCKKGITLNVGTIAGGQMVNKVPESCTFHFDLRVFNLKSSENMMKKIENKVNDLKNKFNTEISVKNLLFIPPFARKISKITSAIYHNLPLEQFIMKGGTEAGYYQMQHIEPLIFGCGALEFAHNKEEHIEISKLVNYTEDLKLILNTIKNIYN